jgi:hypothetical protein
VGNRIGKNGDFRSTRATTLWQRTVRKQLRQTIDGGHTWRGYMVGQARLDRRRAHCAHYRASIRGMDPTQFLDDKTKEKALMEEMKNKYNTDRGMRGIIIKRINDVVTQMAAKIMACKLLRKCRKEEVSTGVVAVATQCVEGTTVSWAPYLLNLFLDDCKDAQDLGT